VHVVISLIGIGTGIVVMAGLLSDRRLPRWTAWFLAATVLTNLTGFGFGFHGFTPAIGTGIVSMAVLIPALYALYGRGLAGFWRPVYVVCATAALYLNVFVLVVQLFVKVPALNALAPTASEPPFTVTQGAVLVAFIVVGLLGLRRFHGGAMA
jgi:hypothetical protein